MKKLNDVILREKGALRLYVDISILGNQIKDDLLSKYFKGDQKTNEGFYIGYREEYVGLLTQCYGTIGLLVLQNYFHVVLNDQEKSIIIRTLELILDHVDEFGYDLSPFIEEKTTVQIFKDKRYRYTDSLSWVLSLITNVRFAYKNNYLELSEELNNCLATTARDILSFYIDTVIGGEVHPVGWGYLNGCKDPSIYFTYAATESYNDFEDYILGNDEIGTKEDREFLDLINEGYSGNQQLHKRMSEIKKKLGLTTWDKFKEKIHTEFLNDNGSVVPKDQIINSTRNSALFTNIFLVSTLIYCETDRYLKNDEEKERLLILTGQSLQMVSSYYDILKNKGLESIVDKHILSFEPHPDPDVPNKIFTDTSIHSTTLTPMLIKANSLLTFYVTKFPDREMSRYFEMAVEKRINNGEQWLWEENKYDLATTERYIEAILDFYDYYEKYEKPYVLTEMEMDRKEQEMERRISEQIRPELLQQVEIELKESHEAELQQQKAELISQFKIEELINEKIQNAIQTQTATEIKKFFEEISLENNNSDGRMKGEASSDSVNIFIMAIKSYLLRFAKDARQIDDEISNNELMNMFETDVNTFLKGWFTYLAMYRGQHGLRWFFENYQNNETRLLRQISNRQ